ncbi:MAG: bactofilin family protein [Thermoanaerobaculia bacterium]
MAIFAKETPSAAPPAPKSEPTTAGGASVIGGNLVVDGRISGDQNLLIEGTVKGEVRLQSDLRIGAKARVEATVHARNVLVEGSVVGDLSADNRVELLASATVDGNIRSPKIIVAEGARFRGAVDMGSAKPHPEEGDQS